jgi:type I restriction enzyme M protein
MSEEQKRILKKKLWAIANLLRGKMDADDYRNYILGFIFFKYLSEKLHHYAYHILQPDKLKYNELDENSDKGKLYIEHVKKACVKNLGYFLKPSELFSSIATKGNSLTNIETNDIEEATQFFIIEDLERILNNIEQSTMGSESEDDFIHLFEDLDLTSSKLGKTVKQKNEIIAKILAHLNQIDFHIQDAKSDLLGDAYEYLIGEFAASAGKKAGEFYTPQEVSTILARIVTSRKKRIKSVYDPTCGSGSLLLRVAKEVKDVGFFYGQELNRTTFNLARMNMILHDVHFSKFDIRQEDTIEEPQHMDIELRAEAIVANPPFSAKWSAKGIFSSDDRFSQYGKLAPKSKADFAFVQHMIHHLDENGIMATVLPHGVLFRGAAEGHIRKYLIEDRNYIDAIIGLPANIFFGTGIPTCIMVIKKCREINEDILFIDASKDFEKQGNQNKLLPEHINKIVEHYTQRKETDKYSYRASLEEIAENDYNLNIPRYVDTFEEEEPVDINAVAEEINALDIEIAETNKRIAAYCKELNIKTPF